MHDIFITEKVVFVSSRRLIIGYVIITVIIIIDNSPFDCNLKFGRANVRKYAYLNIVYCFG